MSCHTGTLTSSAATQEYRLEQARAAKAKARATFRRLGTVAGIGITPMDGGYGLKVNLTREPAPGVVLPDRVDGGPIRVEIVGAVRKL